MTVHSSWVTVCKGDCTADCEPPNRVAVPKDDCTTAGPLYTSVKQQLVAASTAASYHTPRPLKWLPSYAGASEVRSLDAVTHTCLMYDEEIQGRRANAAAAAAAATRTACGPQQATCLEAIQIGCYTGQLVSQLPGQLEARACRWTAQAA